VTVKLNQRAYEHAKKLIGEGKLVNDEREGWSEHHPSTRIEKEFHCCPVNTRIDSIG
jgi:hypothetical protein